MANEKATVRTVQPKTAPSESSMMPVLAPLAGWLIPGLGHVIQKRFVRGVLIFASVLVMFVCGLGMQGRVYGFNVGELLDMLGFVGDFGNGLLYFVARSMDWGASTIVRATADYGTKYLICAGLLNVMAAIDAHHIAIGKKS
jgi:uncharacterized protein DUF6677